MLINLDTRLKERHIFRLFENRILSKIVGHKTEEEEKL
jgi:hypothetical protein